MVAGRDTRKRVIFIINLVQDVNIVRGLAYLVARETGAGISFIMTEAFRKRDRQKIWQRELAVIAKETEAAIFIFRNVDEALAVLQDGAGIIIAAAESNLLAHREVNEVFENAPTGYLRITLQHGFECIGFLQSREHVMSHGRNISFGADVVCGWFRPEVLTSLTASQRSKLVVTGPPTLIQRPARAPHQGAGGGLVCENMHSVRLKASGDHKTPFMDTFFAFCAQLARRGEVVTLRPHPGGQYVLKNRVPLPENVRLNIQPGYHVDFSSFRFGISAPSTIVFDMVLAGLPVGLWRDADGTMDASNYEGLTEISTLKDWLAFERDVQLRPQMILDRQRAFLDGLAMPTDPKDVYRRYARLIIAGLVGTMRRSGETLVRQSQERARSARLAGDILEEVLA